MTEEKREKPKAAAQDLRGSFPYLRDKINGLDKPADLEYNVLIERRAQHMNNADYDPETGKPLDKAYLEENLPPFLVESVKNMKEAWVKKETGHYLNWDCDYCDLQSSINVAEVENLITSEQAWYLREKYLYMRKPGDIDD